MEKTRTHKLSPWQRIYRLLKVVIDFFVALGAIIVLSPLFLIVAIAIKIDSKGPVFFVQKRIGKNGKLFNFIKFRSMSQEARHDVAGYEYAEVNSYITKVGAFIRKYSIDELPQFFNILAGQMSLIGYRPSQPCEHELNDARESYDMYQLRPGITGWAQVNGRDILAAHPTKKAEFDAEYLKKFSLWLDIKIFFMTFSKVWSNECIVEGVIEEPNCEEASVDAPLAEGAESTIVAAATTEVESDAEEEKEVVLK